MIPIDLSGATAGDWITQIAGALAQVGHYQ